MVQKLLLFSLTFTLFLVPPLDLRADDATKASFPGASGSYAGLLLVPDADVLSGAVHVPRGHLPNETSLNSGSLVAKVRDSGQFTALLNWQGYTYRFKGRFDSDTATFERTFNDLDRPGRTLDFSLKLDGANRILNCSLSGVGFNFDDPTDPNRDNVPYTAIGALSGAAPDEQTGNAFAGTLNTSFIAPPDYGAIGQEFLGDGFSLTRVAKNRSFSARIVGRLPDDEPFSAGSRLRGKDYTIFTGLYHRKGRFGGLTIGQLTAGRETEDGPDILQSVLLWSKRMDADPDYYPVGFETGYVVQTSAYLSASPSGGSPAVKPIPNISTTPGPVRATVILKDGNLGKDANGEAIVLSVKVQMSHSGVKVFAPNPQRIVMQTNGAATTWKGSFIHPVTGKRTTFHGGFREAKGDTNGEGRGSFKGSVVRGVGGIVESGSARIVVN